MDSLISLIGKVIVVLILGLVVGGLVHVGFVLIGFGVLAWKVWLGYVCMYAALDVALDVTIELNRG